MQKRSLTPTIADLYLAFRQAKSALFFERRGVGLLELAAYEQELPRNLRVLRSKLASGGWFDNVQLGETWVVPKRLHASEGGRDHVVRIGAARSKPIPCPIDIQLRLSPHPEFAVAEVLYLWRFGALLDALLSREVLGYRLDLRNQQIVRHRRWLFEYWPKRYQQFRTAPLNAAKSALERDQQALIISADLASFYDTIAPSFMLSESFVAELQEAGAKPDDVTEYKHATASLLRSYGRFRKLASRRAATPIVTGVPIGALTSRVVANLSLAPLDRHVVSRPGVLCYRRYVDDVVIVAEPCGEDDCIETIRRFVPLLEADDQLLRLDVTALDRFGSEFELQTRKVRVHRLAGVPGGDFVDAVASDFSKAVSERRAFVDSSTFVGDGVSHLIRAGNAEGSPLRVLRDADRARLERFALSTSLRSLERVSSLINRNEARDIVRHCLERVGRVVDAGDNWVEDLDVSFRFLKLAICSGDWTSAKELIRRMDRTWGTVQSLRKTASNLYYRGREISAERVSPWIWLRNYLHERRLEAISSCLPIGMDAKQIASRFSGRIRLRTSEVKATVLRRRAEQLACADLRSRDREDDAHPRPSGSDKDRKWLLAELRRNDELSERLSEVSKFVQRCDELGDLAWAMPAARLFLCTRPPSYFDISRRWLYRVEQNGFDETAFDELLSIVNAVRGTEYRDPIGRVLDAATISIEPLAVEKYVPGILEQKGPRIILGNLVVEEAAWTAAAKRVPGAPFGSPLLTKKRLQGLAEVLEKASCLSRGGGSEVLVLPELSLPRHWFRTVANHVVRSGRYGLVAGLEYIHHKTQPYVANQVFAVLPGPCMSVAAWPWTKRLPAREEGAQLSKLKPAVQFMPFSNRSKIRTVIHSAWGAFSVLICSEMIEARRVADLLGRVDVVLCPSWNPDTSSYDHLIQSVGFQLHAIIAIANNGHYSDCRAWAPHTERWKRDLCRLIERDVDDVVHVDIPLASLVAFHAGDRQAQDKYARLRAALERGDIKAARVALQHLMDKLQSAWRPLPPDWT
ncbi:RNA-directed DNA polymerase [Tahibacter sp.]|uniref:RNA-directed DNA polymerase n=1 Tax=Tahibacter sp. TaxID=2056211 RepID=UPI0028C44800|nr:RNA-directed DNA polymerase [Tahibacter sp.]